MIQSTCIGDSTTLESLLKSLWTGNPKSDDFKICLELADKISSRFTNAILYSTISKKYYSIEYLYFLPHEEEMKREKIPMQPLIKVRYLNFTQVKKPWEKENKKPVQFQFDQFSTSGKFLYKLDREIFDEERTGKRVLGLILYPSDCYLSQIPQNISESLLFLKSSSKIVDKSIEYDVIMTKFEEMYKISFKNRLLLRTAFTHTSWTNEYSDRLYSNQRLEFLGDAVLDLILDHVFFTEFSKNKITREFHQSISCGEHLSALGRHMNLDEYILKTDSVTWNNNLYSIGQVYEALIGALFIDQGMEKTRNFVKNTLLSAHMKKCESKDETFDQFDQITITDADRASIEQFERDFLVKVERSSVFVSIMKNSNGIMPKLMHLGVSLFKFCLSKIFFDVFPNENEDILSKKVSYVHHWDASLKYILKKEKFAKLQKYWDGRDGRIEFLYILLATMYLDRNFQTNSMSVDTVLEFVNNHILK